MGGTADREQKEPGGPGKKRARDRRERRREGDTTGALITATGHFGPAGRPALPKPGRTPGVRTGRSEGVRRGAPFSRPGRPMPISPVVGDGADNGDRWRARPFLAAAVTVAVFAVPVLFSIGTAALVGHLWAPATTGGGLVVRWIAILGISTVAFLGCERLTRRALPLTVLLRMGMVFPGRAPRRLSVARRSWTTRDLSRRIDEARGQGITDEPTAAAEQIVALAATLSAHDRKTRGHAERVRAFTDLIAEELRLPEDDRDRLRWSALLHDVGKLAVHADILNKPGALSDDEWEIDAPAPPRGSQADRAPGVVARSLGQHHRRAPRTIRREGLSLRSGRSRNLDRRPDRGGGRLYDTMTSLRSYKKPMSTEVARAELAACAGAQFDPVMVRAFLAVSVTRLHAVAPLTWIGSLPFGNLGPQLARMAAAGGRVAATGAAATAGVVGLVATHHAGAAPDQVTSALGGGAGGRPVVGATRRPEAGPPEPGPGAAAQPAGVEGGAGGGDGPRRAGVLTAPALRGGPGQAGTGPSTDRRAAANRRHRRRRKRRRQWHRQ